MPEARGRRNMNDIVRQMGRGNRTAGIVLSICMIILGILFMIRPLITEYAAMIMACIGFIIYGGYEIYVYARTPSELKNGWMLANGIIFIVLGILILFENGAAMFITFAFILGFLALSTGIMQCGAYGALRGTPGAGWVLASGIINIILSIFLLMTPFAAQWALAYVCGIYLIVGGIAFFAEAASGNYGLRR